MFQEPQEVSVTGVQWAWRRTREAEGVSESQSRQGLCFVLAPETQRSDAHPWPRAARSFAPILTHACEVAGTTSPLFLLFLFKAVLCSFQDLSSLIGDGTWVPGSDSPES